MTNIIETLKLKLSSGNDVPVSRISLTREEAEAIINFILNFKEDVTILLNHIEGICDEILEADDTTDIFGTISTTKWNNVTRHLV